MQCKLALASTKLVILFLGILLFQQNSWGQDSAYIKSADTIKHHNPRLSAKYSAIMPGLGQIYN